jgi:glutathione synthase/RimK-type ligase-like ATP-grasp enzyme
MLFGHKYQSSEVPQSLQKALCSFLEAMNLDYGAFDLIQSDNGDWYFLECNPEGQWSAANGLNMDAVLDSFIDGVLLKRSHHSRAA